MVRLGKVTGEVEPAGGQLIWHGNADSVHTWNIRTSAPVAYVRKKVEARWVGAPIILLSPQLHVEYLYSSHCLIKYPHKSRSVDKGLQNPACAESNCKSTKPHPFRKACALKKENETEEENPSICQGVWLARPILIIHIIISSPKSGSVPSAHGKHCAVSLPLSDSSSPPTSAEIKEDSFNHLCIICSPRFDLHT
jgi:hypothetical protein